MVAAVIEIGVFGAQEFVYIVDIKLGCSLEVKIVDFVPSIFWGRIPGIDALLHSVDLNRCFIVVE